jgi:putative transposase
MSEARPGQTNGIPKLRSGSFFPTLLEPRRRIDQALYAVIAQAYVEGVSTRSVDDLVQALGISSGISRREVSRICGRLDVQVDAFRDRPLGHVEFPYVYLDATYLKVRDPNLHQVVSKAVVVATGITMGGDREILGLAVGDSESEAFWSEFVRSLRKRGLSGVRLVISDAHGGLTKAVRRSFQGASWQRSSVHYSPGGLVGWPASLRRDGPVGHPHRRERAMAAGPSRSFGRPVPPVGGGLVTGHWD